jgi:hypothetical protein
MAKFIHNEPINLEEKIELLVFVEDIFKHNAWLNASRQMQITKPGKNYGDIDTTKVNLCCDETTRTEIIHFGDLIKSIPKYSNLKFFEIYIALVFTYYALRYVDPVNYDWLYSKKFFTTIYDIINVEKTQQLIFDITSGDIEINIDGKDKNLSSEIRRAALEMSGGKKKSKKSFKKAKKHKKKRTKNIKKLKHLEKNIIIHYVLF